MDTRDLRRDFLALLDPDEPQHGCTALAEYMATETKCRPEMAKTLCQIVLDPLDWYIQECRKKCGDCDLRAANAFRLAADDIRYRLTWQESICTEEIDALERKWLEFQSVAGYNAAVLLELADTASAQLIASVAAMAPDAAAGKKHLQAQRWKATRPRGRIKVDGEKFSITSIVQDLTKCKDALGEGTPTNDLWPELFSELDRRELDPEESADRIEFTKNDKGELGEIKKSTFRTLVSRVRRKTQST